MEGFDPAPWMEGLGVINGDEVRGAHGRKSVGHEFTNEQAAMVAAAGAQQATIAQEMAKIEAKEAEQVAPVTRWPHEGYTIVTRGGSDATRGRGELPYLGAVCSPQQLPA